MIHRDEFEQIRLFRQEQHELHLMSAHTPSRSWVTSWFQTLAPRWLKSHVVLPAANVEISANNKAAQTVVGHGLSAQPSVRRR